ncbi:IclR family transcriptional regulator [Nonomuraea aurantiaca]|jgi:DNA-binding IclR family transcriptional regulator|uniref:IclR family transcriptional regulator n=1 Tax=Nonomuraea aurantiaca TaxID=2878562 RepID=UPI001CD9E358|nr:IclR family transcriptional regulator [Nonomuraea aurantiaca]MCA2225033.1 IclR family transcriptional regulator [Nonomuraea aurantiaca]
MPSQTAATVERAADILVRFAEAGTDTLGVTELAESLGMSKAAVHRVLASFRSRGLVVLDEESRRYSLGLTAMRLGLAYLDRIDVRRLATPELPALSRLTGETATLSIRTGDTRVYIDQATPEREVIMSVSLGVPYPLHAGGSSKAFLAFLSEEEITRYLSRSLETMTPATVTDPGRLRTDLTLIRRRGYAMSIAERQSGAASVAAPILDHHGRPAAVISVCGPADRFMAEADACAAALLQTTDRLSAELGHH